MSVELVIGGVAVLGVIMTGAGLAVTWKRNGQEQAKLYQELKSNQDTMKENQLAIIKRLDNAANDRQDIRKDIGQMQTHCADVSGRLTERLTGHDREIRDLKDRYKT